MNESPIYKRYYKTYYKFIDDYLNKNNYMLLELRHIEVVNIINEQEEESPLYFALTEDEETQKFVAISDVASKIMKETKDLRKENIDD